jgi:hypothetical protein
MSRTKVNLKDPVFAAILAFLVPGLGHFYQRRIFKGVLYSVCILGAFFGGMRIGHGQVVYFQWRQPENRTYAYLCQFWVGLPALPALAQSQLRSREAFEPQYVTSRVTSRFEGVLSDRSGLDHKTIGKISGTIELIPGKSERPQRGNWVAELKGVLITDAGSERIEGQIERGSIEPAVAPWPRRKISGRFQGTFVERTDEMLSGELEGTLARSIWDSFQAPLQDPKPTDLGNESSDLDRAHRELGGHFELGVVYTMIAGLLNILAIYDALEGPAYEDDEDEGKTDKPPPTPAPPAA